MNKADKSIIKEDLFVPSKGDKKSQPKKKSGSTYSNNSTLPQIGMKLTSNRLEIKTLFTILDLLNIFGLVK